jgi:hypothetical protein
MEKSIHLFQQKSGTVIACFFQTAGQVKPKKALARNWLLQAKARIK